MLVPAPDGACRPGALACVIMHRSLVTCTALAAVLSCAAPLAARCAPAAPSSAPAAPAPGAGIAAGDYLAGIVAGHEGDSGQAADFMFKALSHDPDNMALRAPAFLFAAMAGDPRAAKLASLPGTGLIGTLVTANQAASAGNWRAAADAYASLNGSPLANVLRPLLLAWALQGEGLTDEALQLLAQVPGSNPLSGAAALEAGSIADYAGRVAAAASLYRVMQGVFPASGLGSVQLIGSYLARNGHSDEAAALVNGLALRIPAIGMIAPGLIRSLDRPVIASPSQGWPGPIWRPRWRCWTARTHPVPSRSATGVAPGKATRWCASCCASLLCWTRV